MAILLLLATASLLAPGYLLARDKAEKILDLTIGDGYKPSDLPAEPGAEPGADSGKLRLIPKLDASKLNLSNKPSPKPNRQEVCSVCNYMRTERAPCKCGQIMDPRFPSRSRSLSIGVSLPSR